MSNTNRWLILMKKTNTAVVDEVPEGWDTIKEVARKTKYSASQAQKKMNDLIEVGAAEVKQFRIALNNNTSRFVAHYRIIDEEENK
jgi:predicted transcriptional regulator